MKNGSRLLDGIFRELELVSSSTLSILISDANLAC